MTFSVGTPQGILSVFMYVCTVTHIARAWINRVRLPILHVVSGTGKMDISLSAFAPENLVSRDGFGSPVPRQPAHLHTQAESGAYLRDSSRVPRRLHLFRTTHQYRAVSPKQSSSTRITTAALDYVRKEPTIYEHFTTGANRQLGTLPSQATTVDTTVKRFHFFQRKILKKANESGSYNN